MTLVGLVLIIAWPNVAESAGRALRRPGAGTRGSHRDRSGRRGSSSVADRERASVFLSAIVACIRRFGKRFAGAALSTDTDAISFDLARMHILGLPARSRSSREFCLESTCVASDRHQAVAEHDVCFRAATAQVAISFLLLTARLFVRTLENLQHVDPGFRHDGVC